MRRHFCAHRDDKDLDRVRPASDHLNPNDRRTPTLRGRMHVGAFASLKLIAPNAAAVAPGYPGLLPAQRACARPISCDRSGDELSELGCSSRRKGSSGFGSVPKSAYADFAAGRSYNEPLKRLPIASNHPIEKESSKFTGFWRVIIEKLIHLFPNLIQR